MLDTTANPLTPRPTVDPDTIERLLAETERMRRVYVSVPVGFIASPEAAERLRALLAGLDVWVRINGYVTPGDAVPVYDRDGARHYGAPVRVTRELGKQEVNTNG